MKKVFAILCAWALVHGPFLPALSAQWMTVLAGSTPVATSNLTAAYLQEFNFATLSAANLGSNGLPNTGTWATPTDTGSQLSMGSGQGTALKSTVTIGGNTYTTPSAGYAYQMTLSGTAAAYIQFNPTSYGSAATTWGGALYLPTLTADQTINIAWAYNVHYLRYKRVSGVYSIYLNGTADSGFITVTGGTQYFVSITTQRNATCTLHVYNTSYAEISGSPVTCTGKNTTDFTNPILGDDNGHTASAGSTFKYSPWVFNVSAGSLP